MSWYLTANGEAYTGDQGMRADGTFDPQIADRPDANYSWDGSNWVIIAVAPIPKWLELEMSLRRSDLFIKAFGTAATNAWSLLLSSLHSSAPDDDAGRISDFQFAIAAIRTGLAQDFTADQLSHFNELLESCNFPFRVS